VRGGERLDGWNQTQAMNDLAGTTGTPASVQPGRSGRSRGVLIAAICGVAVAVVALWWPRTTVVSVSTQPAAVTYSDDSVHVAVVKHVRAPIAALRLSDDDASDLSHYTVVLGRDPSGGYGHHVRLDASGADPSGLTVEWTADGAWLTYRSGHRLFVPAASFTGGR
jgi:hypothetical protein